MRTTHIRTVGFLGLLGAVVLAAGLAQAGVVYFGPALTDDASTGISPSAVYTHTVSGGQAVSVNSVPFSLLNSGSTPANFAWDTHGWTKDQVTNNNGDWQPGTGGVTGPGIQGLLNDFTYSGNGTDPPSYQSFTLSGLSPGTEYETRLYVRLWDTAGSGRPIDLTFNNGAEIDTCSLWEDRPTNQGYANDHCAYYVGYTYTAQGATMTIDAAAGAGTPPSGSFHLYGMTNEVALDLDLTPIPGLFNTGVDPSGVPLANDPNAIDPHYQIITNPNGTGLDAHVEDETAFPIVSGPWLANSSESKWIAPEFNTSGAAGGEYVYRTTFDLSAFYPETAWVAGQWASDNAGVEILLNGVPVVTDGNAEFGSYTPFYIPIGSGFTSGLNTLDFKFNNASTGYTGLRVEGLQGAAVLIPEPTSLSLLGLGALLALRRRRRLP